MQLNDHRCQVKLRNNADETLDAVQQNMIASMRQALKTAMEQARRCPHNGGHPRGSRTVGETWRVEGRLSDGNE